MSNLNHSKEECREASSMKMESERGETVIRDSLSHISLFDLLIECKVTWSSIKLARQLPIKVETCTASFLYLLKHCIFFLLFTLARILTGVLLLPVLSSTKAASMTRRPQWFCRSYIEREPQCNQSHSDERRDNVTMCRNNRSQCGCVWKTMQKKKEQKYAATCWIWFGAVC